MDLTEEKGKIKAILRRFRDEDAAEVSVLIGDTLRISNAKDYPPGFIEENVRSHSVSAVAERARSAHFYVAEQEGRIVGCGGITGCWGSTTQSYLISVFVHPSYQGRGIGKRIVEALDNDPYFVRAHRTEAGSSLTAVNFYRSLGYAFKNGITEPDRFGAVRLEKRREKK